MAHLIRTARGREFDCEPHETILAAGERAGIGLAYSCRTGRCSTCKARVADGSTVASAPESGLAEGEPEAGWILTCVRSAESDLTLAEDSEIDVNLPSIRTVPCRVDSWTSWTPDIVEVALRTPPSTKLQWLPGQHVEIWRESGVRRAYSIANRPTDTGVVHLHIRRMESGELSRYWFDEMASNDLLRFRGPLGTFFLRPESERPLVFLATGTGIAPINAMLEDLADTAPQRDVTVLHGVRTEPDLYWRPDPAWPESWTFVPVLSRPGSSWSGATGHVQDWVVAHRRDLSEVEVYACGSDAMVHEARELLIEHGLAPEFFFADAFVSSAPTVEVDA